MAAAPPLLATETITVPDIKRNLQKQDSRLQVFSADGSELVGAEEFRRLRTKLQHAREKSPIKTVVITSALPGEGKTFITATLAQTFTKQHSARVVVIDADLRKPQVHAQLRVPNVNGLADYLAGRCRVEEVIRHLPGSSLDYIVGGPASSRPAELASSERFKELLTTLADTYEWILIDTPPVLPVTDAAIIARYCDAALLVVAAGQTPGDLAQAAQKELEGANLLGVVLNRASRTSSGYKHYYYYKYSQNERAAMTAPSR
jgi:capsular exopolysaccharide synthesis family protein